MVNIVFNIVQDTFMLPLYSKIGYDQNRIVIKLKAFIAFLFMYMYSNHGCIAIYAHIAIYVQTQV